MSELERLNAEYYARLRGELVARGIMVDKLYAAYDAGHFTNETWQIIRDIYHESYGQLEQPWAKEMIDGPR